MSAEPLDVLLNALDSGDDAIAERLFRTYEPYLRMVVRRQLSPPLRAKFDSVDVVQSVWVHVLKGFREAGWRFTDAGHLRGFLVQLTRHRFIDRLRRHRRVLERERPLDEGTAAGASAEPEPGAVAQADELWERMLALCPPAHHEVLRLRRAGAATAEVAARTGLHEGSVRRILGNLASRLRRRERGDGP